MPDNIKQSSSHEKKAWTTPKLMVHGSVEQITRQMKNKSFGAGDDVLVNQQAILANLS